MSTAATSSTTTETTFLLSEWIRRAIDEVDLSPLVNVNASTTVAAPDHPSQWPSQWPANVRNSMALCSDEYLMSALRVAHSLADGLCEAEDNIAEKGGRENNNNDELLPSLLPAPGTNWADKVQVHISSEGAEFNEISKLHFNIKSADFLPSGEEEADSRGEREDGMRRIYSLGIVLYEIFSGGERPPETEMGEQTGGGKSDDGTAELSQELSQETSDKLDPFPIDIDNVAAELNSISEMNLFDDIIDDRYSLCNNIGGDDFFNAENDRKSKRQTQSCSYKVYDVSVEPLKAKCLPGSLCDLVANMLDCANGSPSPSGEDSYHNMSEVRDDLQLMLDKPTIYLYDQDIGRLSITGLQFGGTVFGRNAELSTVKDAYRRSVSGGSELVIISGASGSGKSLLGYEFGKHVSAGGGIVLSG
eukprot:scaffold3305_cov74-Skeletonema_dohrnii-CCMP3373.AAC.6